MKTTILIKQAAAEPGAGTLGIGELAWQESAVNLWCGRGSVEAPVLLNPRLPLSDFVDAWYQAAEVPPTGLPAPDTVRQGNTYRLTEGGTAHGVNFELGDITINYLVGAASAYKIVGFERLSGGSM